MAECAWLKIAIGVAVPFVSCSVALADDPVGQAMSSAVVRWFPSQEALNSAKPSIAFEVQPRPTGAPPAEFPVRPEYAKAGDRTTARFAIKEGDSLYGVGRHVGPMLRNGQTFDNAPVDTPWVLCVHADGTAFGVFVDTTYATSVSLNGEIKFNSDDPGLPLVVIKGETPREVVVALTELTGRMEMPPLWALGYQQFAAMSTPQLKLVVKWLREAKIPSSVLWLACDRTTWPMSFPPAYVPDVKAALDEAKASGFHLVGMISRAIPELETSPLQAAALAGDHVVRDAEGHGFKYEVAETLMYMPDFARKETREWWSGEVAKFLEPGFEGITSQRLTPERLATGVIVRADESLGGPGDGMRYQELLDRQFARAVLGGFGGEKANKRPHVTVDVRGIGAQRYTGALIDWPERSPDWPKMFLSASLSTALSGQPLVGTMVKPPFQGIGSEPNTRWIGVAATFPIAFGSFFLPEDLSTFPKGAEKTLRQAMERRARLIPYIYSQCFSAFFSCQPILQPLFFADPKDPTLRGNESGFLVGDDLLVMPRLVDGPPPVVPLKGTWRKLDFGDSDNYELPDLYLRPGAVIALGPVVQYPDEKPTDPLTIVANPREDGLAEGFLYEDRGEGYEFYKNQARRIGYRITREGDAYMARLSLLDYGLALPDRKLEVRVLTDAGELKGQGSEKGTVKIPIPNSEKH